MVESLLIIPTSRSFCDCLFPHYYITPVIVTYNLTFFNFSLLFPHLSLSATTTKLNYNRRSSSRRYSSDQSYLSHIHATAEEELKSKH
ncbi:hypothetical protein QVD17_05477 [Tagetes erecta]|uniref:Uncharacterized protein n=1 Tax=Tagetes erecta TaxID=13708 RepID=A0AAD8LDW7_TARER|nr:hypothetical protein QVD17_05477 [Tagetes erecta]